MMNPLDRYLKLLDKWMKFDSLVAEAIIANRNYRKLLELRNNLTPALQEAEQEAETYRQAWVDTARRR